MEYEELEQRVNMAPIGTAKLGIDNMRMLMEHLGNPQEELPIIHIAGTNGKGSTAKMTATVLEKAGYRVGLFTSPSLVDFNERIQINREPISDEALSSLIDWVNHRLPEDFVATQFEMFTALAWVAFWQQDVDIVVMEVGLGGRLDATNIITHPLISVITKIALDHVHILGNTLAAIAGEKAGIIKEHRPVISYPQDDEVTPVIAKRAEELAAPLTVVDEKELHYAIDNSLEQTFEYKDESYTITLLEEHQIMNATVVIEIIHSLRNMRWNISNRALHDGLYQTQWAARFERFHILDTDIIIDGSHNVDGITGLRRNLERYYPDTYRLGVMGMVADKDIDTVLKTILPVFDAIIVTEPNNHRAMPANELAHKIAETQLIATENIIVEPDFNQTLAVAKQWLSRINCEKMLTLFGSFYFVGNLRKDLLQFQQESK
ncbi:MAG: bifunctional folylpolyglutamate synthase/dihydrofolate synthase [Aerococcus suis]|nr:bifunctional folylpolyglutamate synthase/dihydrofolate synthase [Aerococcus suis]